MDEVSEKKGRLGFFATMIGVLGVVYGDIGTSVLYAVNESFLGHHPLSSTRENIFGVISFFFWSLFLVVGVKYVLMIMRADNRGEGGIFALMALISSAREQVGQKKIKIVVPFIILGAALLLADGMITPAISVLSAISGLEVLAPNLAHYVVPLTLLVLLALFCVQPFGTHNIGKVFGPLMLVWFVAISVIAVPYILKYPEIFLAINPWYAVKFVVAHGWFTFLTLSSVVLCFTGAEALYADMGHFGRKPITYSWWILIFPALMLNYFGQGALMLHATTIPNQNVFYSLVPSWAMLPMIILATIATIIASQALISGSFSLIQQAIALGVFPRQHIVHTNPNIKGQIYLPFVNWSLMVGCLTLVIIFRSASNLAAAYGIAVTGTMCITTVGFYLVMRYTWGWKRTIALPICLFFLIIDLTFFGSTLLKIASGGYVPVIIAIFLFVIMHTWYWGRGFIANFYQTFKYVTIEELASIKRKEETILLNRAIVVLASRPITSAKDTIPPSLQSRLDHLGAIYRHIAIVSVLQNPMLTHVSPSERFSVEVFQDDEARGSIVVVRIEYGFMETPDLSKILPYLVRKGVVRTGRDPVDQSFTILSGAERIVVKGIPLFDSIRLWLFRVLLRNANTVFKYFNLENFPDVSVEVVTLGATKRQPGIAIITEEEVSYN